MKVRPLLEGSKEHWHKSLKDVASYTAYNGETQTVNHPLLTVPPIGPQSQTASGPKMLNNVFSPCPTMSKCILHSLLTVACTTSPFVALLTLADLVHDQLVIPIRALLVPQLLLQHTRIDPFLRRETLPRSPLGFPQSFLVRFGGIRIGS